MLHFFARRLNELHKEDRKGEKGFTLIELLVVVIIIGILAAIAIPVFLGQRQRAQQANVESDVRNAGSAYTTCFVQTNTAASCDSDAELDAYGFNGSAGVTRMYTVSGNDLTVTASIPNGPSATFRTATGQVTAT